MTAPHNFSVREWSVFPAQGLLIRGETRAHLRPKTMDLLVLLAGRLGETVLREEIFEALWADTVVEEGAVSRCVSELREAFGDDARQPRYVQTIPRRGYRLIAPVVPLNPAPQAQTASGGQDRRPRWVAAGVVAALLVASVTIALTRRETGVAATGDRYAGPPTTAAAPRAVVLGVANLSGDPEADWLGEAFSHLLTTELAATTDLRLVPAPVAGQVGNELALRDVQPPTAAVLARLHDGMAVDYLVSGHYVLTGDTETRDVRLDVDVTDTASGEIVAAATESGPTDDLPQVVTLATMRLREALGLPAPAVEIEHGGLERTAQDLPEELFRGLLLLERFEATAATSALERAVERAPNAPWPHLALAEAWSLQGYDRRAGEELEKALARSAGLERENRLWFEARAHALARRWDDAIERLRALWLLEPDNLEYGLQLASTLLEAGRAEQADTVVTDLRKHAPDSFQDPRLELVRGGAALALSDPAAALDASAAADEQARSLNAPLIEARALHLRARALHAAGQAADARAALETARQRFALAHDRRSEAAARLTLSLWLAQAGEFPAAETEARTALAVSRSIGDRAGEAAALRRLSLPAWEQNRRDEGEKALRTALTLSRQIGDRAGEADALSALGVGIAKLNGDGDVEPYFRQALAIYRELGQRERVSSTLINLGQLALFGGHPLRAVEVFDEVSGMGDVLTTENRARVLVNLGYARMNIGEVAGAQTAFEQACALYRQMENQRLLAASLEGLGETLLVRGEVQRALAPLREGLRINREVGEPVRITFAQNQLAWALLEAGQVVSAERLVRQALATADSATATDARLSAQSVLAQVQLATGRAAEALAGLEDVRQLPIDQGTINDLSRRVVYARVLAATGRAGEADELLQSVIDATKERGMETVRLEAEVARLEVARAEGHGPGPDHVAEVVRQARQRGLLLLATKAQRYLDSAPPEEETAPATHART